MKHLQQILESKENVVWEGRQHLVSAMLSTLFGFILIFGMGLVFYFVMSSGGGECLINDRPASPDECARMGKLISYGLFAVAVFILVGGYMMYKVTVYAITDKRLLIKSGLIGADIRSIYFDQVKTAFVDVGIIGRIFGTGTIKIDTGRMTSSDKGNIRTQYDMFKYIQKPYEVFTHIQGYLSGRKESLYSGRADREHNSEAYKK